MPGTRAQDQVNFKTGEFTAKERGFTPNELITSAGMLSL